MFDKKEYSRKYYQEHREKLLVDHKKWRDNNVKYIKDYYQNHKEKIYTYKQEYYDKHKEETQQYQQKYYMENKNKLSEQYKIYRKEHKEEIKLYRINNKEKLKEYNKEYGRGYQVRMRKVDLKFNLNCKMKSAINISLKGGKTGRHWETLVGYTLENLIEWLKITMPEGYTWQDYMEGRLHIDHKIPISVFNFKTPEHPDFKRCWALSNLQLLPAKENLIKSNKLLRPFQPSLAM